MKIVLATNNMGKLHEFQSLLKPHHFTLVSQSDFAITDTDETGLTFVENAIIKARHACEKTGLPAIADDSGLEVATLKGKPGIYSARYAGKTATASANIQKLLSELKTTKMREAQFHCVLVFMSHSADPAPLIAEGFWRGIILTAPQGTNGFGYDPIFYDPEIKCSAAELTLENKNKISHRARALNKLLELLPEKISYERAFS